jgi:hypothetical protein
MGALSPDAGVRLFKVSAPRAFSLCASCAGALAKRACKAGRVDISRLERCRGAVGRRSLTCRLFFKVRE